MVHVSTPLDYENHLELRLIKDKAPDPPKNNGGTTIITVTVTATLAITLTLSLEPNFSFPVADDINNPSVIDTYQVGGGGNKLETVPPDELPFPAISGQKLEINNCNGVHYDGANFRVEPAITPLVIRGVVPVGEWVTLTGATAYADNIIWYQVTNDSELESSIELNAQNRTRANQVGWIADCFLD